MKLSKITFQWLVYHALHSDVAGYTEFKIIKEINDALENGTLEIEGYERTSWTKFDPNDPKTFPPYQEFFLVYYDNKYVVEVGGCVHNSENGYEHLITAPSGDLDIKRVTHWRPLPPAPGKE